MSWPVCARCGRSLTVHRLRGLSASCSGDFTKAGKAPFKKSEVAEIRRALGMPVTAKMRETLAKEVGR